MQVRDETFTLQIRNGKLDIIGPEHSLKRASDLGEIIKQFAGLVPDFQMTFTRHDQPAVQLEYAQKERMIELAEMGERELLIRMGAIAVSEPLTDLFWVCWLRLRRVRVCANVERGAHQLGQRVPARVAPPQGRGSRARGQPTRLECREGQSVD